MKSAVATDTVTVAVVQDNTYKYEEKWSSKDSKCHLGHLRKGFSMN